MDRFVQARDRGVKYLLSQLHDDGSFGNLKSGVLDYYKVPSAFVACGENRAASRLCSWIREFGMTPEGDYIPRDQTPHDYAYVYFNSWTIIGAHRLGQFDISQKGMDFLTNFWDPESGGFYSSPLDRYENTLQDLWITSGAGQAAIYTGRIEIARGVGRWMETLMRGQPNFPNQLYGVYSRSEGVITKPDPDDEFRYLLNYDAQKDEPFYNPGIAAGFLAKLYQTTGERQWLKLAEEYMTFTENASDYLFRLLRAGKVGWASSVLYTLTGQVKYRDMAVRVGDNLIATQKGNGSWHGIAGMPDEPNNDITAELVVWLDEIHQAVGNSKA